MASSGETFNRTFQGGKADRVRDRSVRETRQSLKRQAIPIYTVYNLHRFPLFVSLGDMGYIRVPARREGRPYGKYLIAEPRFTMRDLGDSNFSAEAVFPEVLAQEVAREYAETGGVFIRQGHEPPTETQIWAAKEAQLHWYRREYRKAVDAWYRYHQHKFITDRQRDAARELALRREIPALPEWVDATQETIAEKFCPQCGEAIKAVAKICRYCRSQQPEAATPAKQDTPQPGLAATQDTQQPPQEEESEAKPSEPDPAEKIKEERRAQAKAKREKKELAKRKAKAARQAKKAAAKADRGETPGATPAEAAGPAAETNKQERELDDPRASGGTEAGSGIEAAKLKDGKKAGSASAGEFAEKRSEETDALPAGETTALR